MRDHGEDPNGWAMVGAMLTRPYPLRPRVVVPAVTLMVMIPFYLVIAAVTADRTLHAPELALDRMIPVQPDWAVIYLSYLLSPFLPLLLLRAEEQIRRTFLAWLLVWSVGYACFLVYPTIAPRTDVVEGKGFFAWFLQGIYDADPPRNCFPSLHVATALVAALACGRAHRGVAISAGLWSGLVAVSTVFTKQHYVVDVIAGMFLAGVAYGVFLRDSPRVPTPENDRRAAPLLALGLFGIYGLFVAGSWVAYQLGGEP
jgi:membrane-associated phospholipid phosphatase